MSFIELLRDCGIAHFHLFLKGGIGDILIPRILKPNWTTPINRMRFVQIPKRYWDLLLGA